MNLNLQTIDQDQSPRRKKPLEFQGLFRRFGQYAQGSIVLIVFFTFYELMAINVDNTVLLPRLTDIWNVLIHFFSNPLGLGSMAYNLLISILRLFTGLFTSLLAAVPLGLAMGLVPVIRRMINPFIELLRPICPCVWLPFALIIFKTSTIPSIFGFRYTLTILDELNLAMIFIVFLGGFFPILLETVHGVDSLKRIYIESARVMGVNRRKIFFHVILPGAFPSIIQGVRIGIGVGWISVVVGEMLPGSETGIGHMIMFAFEIAETSNLLAGMLVIGLTGLTLNHMFELTNRFVRWKAREI